MSLKFIFAIISSLISIFCLIPYIIDTINGKTKPHSYSWLIWSILQTVGLISMLSAGAGIGILSLCIGAFFCIFIFILSLYYGTHNIKLFDKICLAGALVAVIIYFFIHDATLAIIVVVITDFIGFLPTIRKSYEEPKTETPITYILSAVAAVFAIAALSVFNFTTSIYLISLVISDGICGFIILYRRNRSI